MYLVLTVFALHIIAGPLIIKIDAVIDSDGSAGKIVVKLFFIPIFVKKTGFEKFRRILDGKNVDVESDKEPKKSGFKKALIRFIVKVGLETAKRVRVRELRLTANVGTGEAASTAVAVSTLQIAYLQACTYFGVPVNCEIHPDYDTARLFMMFFGIISLCIADIIVAVCSVIAANIAEHGKRRVYGNGVKRI